MRSLLPITTALLAVALQTSPGQTQEAPPKIHPLAIALWHWTGKTAKGTTLRNILPLEGGPAQVAESLAGTKWENKTHLRVTVIWEMQQDAPGVSPETMAKLEEVLAKGNCVLADVSRENWRPSKGKLPPEKTPEKKIPAPSRVVLTSSLEPGSYTIFFGERGEQSLISREEVARALTSAAIAEVSISEKTVEPEPLPAEFKFDSTLIKKGHYAFIRLPLLEQDRGGICTAASALNIVKYLDEKIDIGQREVFALFNDERSGANMRQVAGGLETLGFEAELIFTRSENKSLLLEKVKAALDENRPIIATIPGHALTLIGYCNATRKLIAWDQRMSKPGSPACLPAGGFEVSEQAIQSRFDSLVFVRRTWVSASEVEQADLSALRPYTKEVRRHEIVNANARTESLKDFLGHASAPKINALLNAGRIPLIQVKGKKILEVSEKTEKGWRTKEWPLGTEEEMSTNALERMLFETGGILYSAPAIAQTPIHTSIPK